MNTNRKRVGSLPAQDDSGEELSTRNVIALLMVVIGLFGWASAAAAYAHAKEGWRYQEQNTRVDSDGIVYDERFKDSSGTIRQKAEASFADFVFNAFRQIPNLFSVIAFNFKHRLWLVILFALLEGGAVLLGYAMGKVGQGFVDTPKY